MYEDSIRLIFFGKSVESSFLVGAKSGRGVWGGGSLSFSPEIFGNVRTSNRLIWCVVEREILEKINFEQIQAVINLL